MAWRDGLNEVQRRRLNHPGAVWHAWRRASSAKGQKSTDVGSMPIDGGDDLASHVNAAAERARRGRPVFWDQDAMRRAHAAMLKSQSHDLLTLARVALQEQFGTKTIS